METKVVLFVVALSLMVTIALGAKPDKPTLTVSGTTTVDAGISLVFTCEKASTGYTTSTWKWSIGADKQTETSATFTYVAVTADNNKLVTCTVIDGTTPSEASDGKTLTITDVKPPVLKSSIDAKAGKVTVDNGFPVIFTCTKGESLQEPNEFKFYAAKVGGVTTEITNTSSASITGGKLVVTASSTWEGKEITCTHFNTESAKAVSTEKFTLAVTMVPDPPTIDFKTPLTEGDELKVTCTKTGKNDAVTEFKIYKDTKKLISTGTLKETYVQEKVTIAADNGKKFKCLAMNAKGDSNYSAEETLVVVEAGAASQLVSMTTMALVLALGVFFKE